MSDIRHRLQQSPRPGAARLVEQKYITALDAAIPYLIDESMGQLIESESQGIDDDIVIDGWLFEHPAPAYLSLSEPLVTQWILSRAQWAKTAPTVSVGWGSFIVFESDGRGDDGGVADGFAFGAFDASGGLPIQAGFVPYGESLRDAVAYGIKNAIEARGYDGDKEEISNGISAVLRYIIAAAAIARSRIVVQESAHIDRAERKRWGNRPVPGVKWIKLRRVVREATAAEQEEAGRQLKTRPIRRGHFHTVLFGPGRTQRRIDWFAPTIVGPDGAPLIIHQGRIFSIER